MIPISNHAKAPLGRSKVPLLNGYSIGFSYVAQKLLFIYHKIFSFQWRGREDRPLVATSPCLSPKIREGSQFARPNSLGLKREEARMRVEMEQCYELINKLGRGVVYLGSSRMGPDHSHSLQAFELGGEVANLLDCTPWTGAGPGLMDAATKGALQAGKPVGGFKIGREAGQSIASSFHPYLPSETYFTCRFFSTRKHGLVDAAVRNSSCDQTAVIALPGGIGTLDEVFEILALIQLQRIGSEFPVPFLLMNYGSFYSKLLDFLRDCECWGTVYKGEVESLWKVCNNNTEALCYLAEFYGLPLAENGKCETGLPTATGAIS